MKRELGFSVIELIIVMLVISILAVFSILAFRSEKVFLADSEAYLIMDVLNEARQRALTQHQTMRVEISKTKNVVRLINEKNKDDATDDQVIKTVTLHHSNQVRFDVAPSNIANSPTELSPVPAAVFKTSTHPLSSSEQVATFRFLQNGTVVNGGSNAIGANSVMTGATIFVWMPFFSESNQPLMSGFVIRSITLLGSSGSTKYWKCPVSDGQCTEWGL